MPELFYPAKLHPAVALKRLGVTPDPVRRILKVAGLSVSGTALFMPCGHPRLRAEILEPFSSSLPSWLAPGRRTAFSTSSAAAGGRA